MPERTVRLVNRLGLHARAAARFVDLAGRFRSSIGVVMGGIGVDGKSILGILTLAAPCGTELRLVAEGDDAEAALAALAALVAEGFGEEPA
ncbi:MAG: HPr family phosphocarrier protein [Acidobacteria bacterium]|nr:HPr family phosphocarrier protein [Acidobacteriota bacterium]